jgi:hypothetical protein
MSKHAHLYKTPFRYPTYIYAYHVALVCGWEPRRVTRLWKKHDIAQKVGGYIVTTPEKLQMLWPEQWEAILDLLEQGKLDPPPK